MGARFDLTRDIVNIGVLPNKSFGLVAYVKNIGDAPGTCRLDLRDHVNQIRAYTDVYIQPNEEKRVILWADNSFEEGSYGWTLYALNKDNNYNIDDRDDFTLNSTNDIAWGEIVDYPQSIDAKPSESKTITVKLKNVGAAYGQLIVYLLMGEDVLDRKEYTLNPSEEIDVQLSITAPSSPGTYNLKVQVYRIDDLLITDEKQITLNVSSGEQPPPSPSIPFDISLMLKMLLPIMILVFIIMFIIMLLK